MNQQNNQSSWELESQNDLGYGQLFNTLWQRRYWFAGVFGGVLALSVPLALMKKPIYQSHMQVLPESNYQAKQIRHSGVNNNQYLESQFTDNSVEIDYPTQLKVLRSSEILKRVINKLGWEVSATEKAELIEALRGALVVSQIADVSAEDSKVVQTKIIQTVYYGESPEGTQQVLNAIKEVYLEYNLEQQEKRLKDGLVFIERQIPKAQKELNKAESAVTELSKKYNVVNPEQEAIALKENIRNIALEREALSAEQSQITGNYQALQQQLGLSTESSVALSRLSQSGRYQNLLNELQAIELQLAAKRTKHQERSPVVQGLVEQKANQQNLLRNEARRILGTLPANFEQELESMRKEGQIATSDTQFISEITQAQANLTGIKDRAAALAATEARLKDRLTEFPELISQYKDLTQEAQVKLEALQRLREAKQELEIELNRGGFNWQVIEPPQLGVQIGPNLKKDLLLSVVVASFLGISTAFVREAIDERISSLKETERQTALPMLGSTPALLLPSSSRFMTKLPFFSGAHVKSESAEVIQWQPFREALDVVYENLRLSGLTSSLHSLAITSATVGEGKSTLILGLALSVARHQQRVLVIDADLRRSGLHKSFNLPNQTGLTDYLAGEIDEPDIEQVFLQGEHIDLITSGSKTDDPVKLLSSSRLKKLIEQYELDYDLILIDTPPAIGMVDAVKIASICDSVLLMMRLNKVKSSELLEAEALLSKLNVLGIVANDSKEYETKTTYLLPQSA
ncbi:MAG: polysaccharide biosynthesis tyrosine autokinase [Cyanobacteria bacterium P01_C01_bin.72]